MASIILFSACVGLIIYWIYKYMVYKPNNFPPGPPRLPFIGSYLYMLFLNYNHLHKAAEWLCKYYKTKILGLYLGDYPTIVVYSTENVKESLTKPEFDGKPQILLSELRDPDFHIRGIFFMEAQKWHEQRRFLLRNLRDYGFGRRFNELELDINDEVRKFFDMIDNGPKYPHEKKFMKNGSVLCPNIFHVVFMNSFLKVLLNERFPREKHGALFDAAEYAYQFLIKSDDWGRMFSLMPSIAKLFPNWSGYNEIKDLSSKFYKLVKELIDEEYKTFDSNHERHFLDLYFQKIKESDSNPDSTFYYKQLILLCADIFTPAMNANSITLQFLLQRVCLQPEILNRIQKEIDTVVGQGRLPSLDDRVNLPYTEATLRETLRVSTLVPSGLPHRALTNTTFMGYDIPKDTIIVSLLDACNKDPEVFEQPEMFKPERFLDENGQLSLKKDKSLPFGAGKRLCAGETFARNTLFLVTTALFQRYNIKVPANERMPDPSETRTGIAITTPKFWIKFEPR